MPKGGRENDKHVIIHTSGSDWGKGWGNCLTGVRVKDGRYFIEVKDIDLVDESAGINGGMSNRYVAIRVGSQSVIKVSGTGIENVNTWSPFITNRDGRHAIACDWGRVSGFEVAYWVGSWDRTNRLQDKVMFWGNDN